MQVCTHGRLPSSAGETPGCWRVHHQHASSPCMHACATQRKRSTGTTLHHRRAPPPAPAPPALARFPPRGHWRVNIELQLQQGRKERAELQLALRQAEGARERAEREQDKLAEAVEVRYRVGAVPGGGGVASTHPPTPPSRQCLGIGWRVRQCSRACAHVYMRACVYVCVRVCAAPGEEVMQEMGWVGATCHAHARRPAALQHMLAGPPGSAAAPPRKVFCRQRTALREACHAQAASARGAPHQRCRASPGSPADQEVACLVAAAGATV